MGYRDFYCQHSMIQTKRKERKGGAIFSMQPAASSVMCIQNILRVHVDREQKFTNYWNENLLMKCIVLFGIIKSYCKIEEKLPIIADTMHCGSL